MRTFLLFPIYIVAVRADLTCLAWGLLALPLGLICHFKHDTFNAVENATVVAVEQVAEEVKDAAVFEIEHHPAVLGYEWVSDAIHNGTHAANQHLKSELKRELKVTVGIGKEVVNTAVQLYELTHWNDLVLCLMSNAYSEATGNTTEGDEGAGGPSSVSTTTIPSSTELVGSRTVGETTYRRPLPTILPSDVPTAKKKRLAALSLEQGKSIVARCANEKFNSIAKPQVFNITDPDEKIGSTLAQLALFFVPIGGEEAAGAKLIEDFDLAIPGAEDAGRIYQKVEGQAAHFATEEDALAVRENLGDSDWVDENCDSCTPPAGASSSIGKRTQRARDAERARLGIRGGALSVCCDLPAIVNNLLGDYEVADPHGPAQELIEQPLPYYDPVDYTGRVLIPESALQTAPQLKTWTNTARESANILQDLQRERTAALAWSGEVTAVSNSQDIFSLIRKVFNPGEDAEFKNLAQGLRVSNMNGPERQVFTSFGLETSRDLGPSFEKLKQFNDAVIQQGIDTVKDLKGFIGPDLEELQGTVDYYWIPADEGAIRNPDPRGLHVDGNILQFGAGDQPGLVIQGAQQKLFRVPVLDNTWHLLKCTDWEEAGGAVARRAATKHTVFGPDIVKNGRASIIVNIFKPLRGGQAF